MKCNCNYPEHYKNKNKKTAKYSYAFDSYYCEKCDMWLEPDCGCGSECEFSGRPEKPSDFYGDVE